MLKWLRNLLAPGERKGIHEFQGGLVKKEETIGHPPRRQPSLATLKQRRQKAARRKNRE